MPIPRQSTGFWQRTPLWPQRRPQGPGRPRPTCRRRLRDGGPGGRRPADLGAGGAAHPRPTRRPRSQPARRRPVPQYPFPSAEELLALPDEAFRMPAARRATLRALATAVAGGELDLDGGADRHETAARSPRYPGSGRGPPDTLRSGHSATRTSFCPPISGRAGVPPRSACRTALRRSTRTPRGGTPGARTRSSDSGGSHDQHNVDVATTMTPTGPFMMLADTDGAVLASRFHRRHQYAAAADTPDAASGPGTADEAGPRPGDRGR